VIYSVKIKDNFILYYDICHVFNFYLRAFFYKTNPKTINPKTEIKLTFQKAFAFLSSMNSKETKRNFNTDNPIIKTIAHPETDIVLEIKAVEAVNTINKP
jgi:hypothetical protein